MKGSAADFFLFCDAILGELGGRLLLEALFFVTVSAPLLLLRVAIKARMSFGESGFRFASLRAGDELVLRPGDDDDLHLGDEPRGDFRLGEADNLRLGDSDDLREDDFSRRSFSCGFLTEDSAAAVVALKATRRPGGCRAPGDGKLRFFCATRFLAFGRSASRNRALTGVDGIDFRINQAAAYKHHLVFELSSDCCDGLFKLGEGSQLTA
jgi:hypothetical protein